MTGENEHHYEQIYKAHMDWVDKDAAARILEETKSLVFAQKCAALGDIPVNRAEQTIKASRDWHNWVTNLVNVRTEANKAKARYEYEKNRKEQYMNEEANHRAESRL